MEGTLTRSRRGWPGESRQLGAECANDGGRLPDVEGTPNGPSLCSTSNPSTVSSLLSATSLRRERGLSSSHFSTRGELPAEISRPLLCSAGLDWTGLLGRSIEKAPAPVCQPSSILTARGTRQIQQTDRAKASPVAAAAGILLDNPQTPLQFLRESRN